MNYQILASAVCFTSETGKIYLDLMSDNTLRVFRDPTHLSPVLGPVRLAAHYAIVALPEGGYQLQSSAFIVKVSPALFLTFTTLEGKLLAEEIEPLPSPRLPLSPNELSAAEGHPLVNGFPFVNAHHFALHEDERFYGLGDHISPLDKREYRFINYNTDYPQVHEESVPSLYKDFPFFLVKRSSLSFGFYLDNSYAKVFDFGTNQHSYFFADKKGDDDFYFIYGPSPKDVVSEYSRLLGRAPLPQRWTLGNQQSRWSYGDEASVLAVVEGYEKADIPLEAIHLDIDYMEG